jgi:hypothetical protein
MPRAFKAAAIARCDLAPAASIWRTMGRTFAAKASAAARFTATPLACASPRLVRLPQQGALRLLLRQRRAGPVGDHAPLFLGQGGVNVQHERARVGAQFGHDERHPLRQTRAGGCCRQPAMRNGRCRMHGGPSTGPRTAEGLARMRHARTSHGMRTAEMEQIRQLDGICPHEPSCSVRLDDGSWTGYLERRLLRLGETFYQPVQIRITHDRRSCSQYF